MDVKGNSLTPGTCRRHRLHRESLNPYLNYHRSCAQPDAEIDEKGRKRVRYKRYQTPLETLLALDKPAQFLRQGLASTPSSASLPPSATQTRHAACSRQ